MAEPTAILKRNIQVVQPPSPSSLKEIDSPPQIPSTNPQQVVSLPKEGGVMFTQKHADEITKTSKEVSGQKRLLDWTFGFIVAILAICVVGFFTLLYDVWKFHGEEVDKNTNAIEQLKNDRINKSLDEINSRLNRLESPTPAKESVLRKPKMK